MATSLSRFRRVAPALVEQRAAPRHAVSVARATVRRLGEAAHDAVLEDVSIYGCLFTSAVDELPGERLWLRLAGSMPIAATVVWSENGRTGCRFDASLDRALFRALTVALH